MTAALRSRRQSAGARWVRNVRVRGVECLGEGWRAHLEAALDADLIQAQTLEAWCEKNQRM
eukprot:5644657-Pyramimonas_sp.AAC.1